MDKKGRDLCSYRLEKAEKCLSSARLLSQSYDYCGTANRSYYSIFHCIRSLLALEGGRFFKTLWGSGVFSKALC